MQPANPFDSLLPAVEEYLWSILDERLRDAFPELRESIFYQFGFSSEQQTGMKGKHIRPMLVLLTTDLLAHDWRKMLPAACAVEMLHNFSLIHDDIEDHSSLRRGRETIWKKWGIEKAVNIGDMLFILAVQTIQSTQAFYGAEKSQQAAYQFMQAAYSIMQGQQMDMAFEGEENLKVEKYLQMIENKTAALFAYACEVSALLVGSPQEICQALYTFGLNIGMAFQIYDDWLGIWGSAEKTGKTECSDLIEKKLSYPVLLALRQNSKFSELWRTAGKSSLEAVQTLKNMLDETEIEDEVLEKAAYYNDKSLKALESINGREAAKIELRKTAEKLIKRKL